MRFDRVAREMGFLTGTIVARTTHGRKSTSDGAQKHLEWCPGAPRMVPEHLQWCPEHLQWCSGAPRMVPRSTSDGARSTSNGAQEHLGWCQKHLEWC